MREAQWIEWTRTALSPRECADLLAAATSEQKAHLLEHDYVFGEGIGVLWRPADGGLRRARFTHGTHFATARGEFYIDSEGSVRETARPEPALSRASAGSPRAPSCAAAATAA